MDIFLDQKYCLLYQLKKYRKELKNLSKTLPESDDSLARLIIYTDGADMFVNEKGKYFSATTMQRFLKFDTEEINNEVIELYRKDNNIRNLSIPVNY